MRKPKRPCNKIGCRNITTERYCEQHAHIVHQQRKERHRYYDKYQRDQQASSFYKSKAWERARQQVLIRDHGLCQHCLKEQRITLADMVDHMIPIKVDWSKRLLLSNLQSLCNRCHAIKTAEDKREYG